MIARDAVLPEIERAVEERVESHALVAMGPDDLRDLIYKLVERQRVADLDPSRHFADLVATASERHADMASARAHSIAIRKSILDEILKVLKPALPSLLGLITVETTQRPEEQEIRRTHPLLCGFELFNGEKQGPVGPDVYARSGHSWWIVGIHPGRPQDPISPRYAIARHFGKSDREGGKSWSDLELVTSEKAASQIRDNQFEKILEGIHARLVALTGKKVKKTTDSLWRVVEVLEAGLSAMKSTGAEDLS